jgi:hypothetical protein
LIPGADHWPRFVRNRSEEVALFTEQEIPWQEIAFPVVKSTLEHYFEDLRRNRFPVRMFDVHHGEDRSFTTSLISASDFG